MSRDPSAELAAARSAEDGVRAAYERVPYPSQPHYHCHPDHLATLGWLHGLSPAPPAGCRVLELGCADGGNLLSMAAELPQSRFLGIDLSPSQIAAGEATRRRLGIENLELRAASILDLDGELGRFDYLVCHGVFSWVQPAVQEKILALCGELLAPQGIAYVSYNTYPGWHSRGMVRDMLLYHLHGIDDPDEQLRRGYQLIDFLARAAGDQNDAHAVFLRQLAERFAGYRDRPSYVLHEYFEASNQPFYFHDFIARAERHGLQYLAEAETHLFEPDNLKPHLREQVAALAEDRIGREQYMDFAFDRTFRKTLLCRQGLPLERSATPERLRPLAAASATQSAAGEPDLRPGAAATFRTAGGTNLATSHPLAKVVLAALGEIWPRCAGFAELGAAIAPRLAAVGEEAGEAELAEVLATFYWSGVADLHLAPPHCVEKAGPRPEAAELARRQVAAGLLVTARRRHSLKLEDELARFLLPRLDGSREREALVGLLEAEVEAGRLELEIGGGGAGDGERRRGALAELVDRQLRKMAEFGLLVG